MKYFIKSCNDFNLHFDFHRLKRPLWFLSHDSVLNPYHDSKTHGIYWRQCILLKAFYDFKTIPWLKNQYMLQIPIYWNQNWSVELYHCLYEFKCEAMPYSIYLNSYLNSQHIRPQSHLLSSSQHHWSSLGFIHTAKYVERGYTYAQYCHFHPNLQIQFFHHSSISWHVKSIRHLAIIHTKESTKISTVIKHSATIHTNESTNKSTVIRHSTTIHTKQESTNISTVIRHLATIHTK